MYQKRTRLIVAAAALAVIGGSALSGCSGDDGPGRTAAIGATTTPAPAAGYSIDDGLVDEGDSLYRDAKVRVQRNTTATTAGSVKVTSIAGTAKPGTQTDGGDFAAATTTVTFAAGVKSVLVSVRVFGDTVLEPDEAVTLVLSAPVGDKIGDGLGVLTITNDDKTAPADGFVAGNETVSESSGTLNVPVFRYGSTKYAATVDVAVTSTSAVGCRTATDMPKGVCDYTKVDKKTLTFAIGVAVVTVPVTFYNDYGNPEGDEILDVELTNPTGGGPSYSSTFPLPTTDGEITLVSVTAPATGAEIGDAAVTEGQSGNKVMTFTVTRSGDTTRALNLTWSTAVGTATAADFTPATGTLSFAKGVASLTISVNITGDTTVEPNEAFTVTLKNSTNTPMVDAVATGTIVNDD